MDAVITRVTGFAPVDDSDGYYWDIDNPEDVKDVLKELVMLDRNYGRGIKTTYNSGWVHSPFEGELGNIELNEDIDGICGLDLKILDQGVVDEIEYQCSGDAYMEEEEYESSRKASRKRFKRASRYVSKSEGADLIRKALKDAGYKVPAQVSVTTGRGGYDRSYTVTIKDLNVPIEDVRRVVNKYKDVSYDPSGDVLLGGNTYIFTRYDYKKEDTEKSRLSSKEEEVISECFENSGEYIDFGKGLKICVPSNYRPDNDDFSYNYILNGKEKKGIKNWDIPVWLILYRAGF